MWEVYIQVNQYPEPRSEDATGPAIREDRYINMSCASEEGARRYYNQLLGGLVEGDILPGIWGSEYHDASLCLARDARVIEFEINED